MGGIQWTPGAGQDPLASDRWLPLYQQTQAAGKKLWLLGPSREGLWWLMERLDPRGLFLSIGANSEDEAREILRQAERVSASRR